MNERFRPCSLDRLYLLPPSLQDWLPARHLARFIAEVVEELDLGAIRADRQRKDGRGQAAYHPLMLTRILLYAYAIGLTSSRRIENRLRSAKKNAEQPSRQYNFTDPDSRVMHDNGRGGFLQAHNAQAAVDGQAQVIVAAGVTQQVVDRAQLLPMCERMREMLGAVPPVITADAGYWDTTSMGDAALRGTELLIAPDAMHHWANPKAGRPSAAVERMRERLREEPWRTLYKQRREIVEPVFGQIKEARGLRRFAFRGRQKVKAEWQLICLMHNLLKLFRYGWTPQTC